MLFLARPLNPHWSLSENKVLGLETSPAQASEDHTHLSAWLWLLTNHIGSMLLNESSRPFFTTEPKCFLPQTCHTREPQHMSQYSWTSHYPGWVSPLGFSLPRACPKPAYAGLLVSVGHNPPVRPLGIKGIFLSGPQSEPKSALSRCCAAASPTLPRCHLAPSYLSSPGLPRPAWPQPLPARPQAALPVEFSWEPADPIPATPASLRTRAPSCATALCWPGWRLQHLPCWPLKVLQRAPRTQLDFPCGRWSTTLLCISLSGSWALMPAALWAMPTSWTTDDCVS